MRKLIYISLIVFAGCETILTPQPPAGPSGSADLAGYFWHDSTQPYHYQSLANNQIVGSQTIQMSGGTIFDVNQSGAKTMFTVNGSYAMSGFTPFDIFGFDSSLKVVADTTVPSGPRTETIRSIATATLFGQQKLYAASDSVLYSVDAGGSNPALKRIGGFRKNFTLAEDAQNEFLFAYRMGSDSIMWTADGANWAGDTTLAGITAFTSATLNFFHDLCWFACGTDVYLITDGSFPKKVASLPSKVITLAGENNGVAAGLDNGAIYDVARSGQTQPRQSVPTSLQGIALVPSVITDPILAGTSNGVFTIPSSGPVTQIDHGAVSAIFSTGNSIFASVNVDSVFHYNADGSHYRGYANPNSSTITQFAHPTSAVPSPSYGIYVLSGSTIFRLDSDVAGSRWTMVNQSISAPPAFTPGSLTLLDSNSSWIAGFIESNIVGSLRGYAYTATSTGPFTSYKAANDSTYSNVLIINYTAKANGITNTTNVPQYNIYYEKSVGPVIIEKSENGTTITTSLVK